MIKLANEVQMTVRVPNTPRGAKEITSSRSSVWTLDIGRPERYLSLRKNMLAKKMDVPEECANFTLPQTRNVD